MLIDEYMPRFEVRERHGIIVRASPEETYRALWEADLAASRIVGLLLAMRAVPAALARGLAGARELRSRGLKPFSLRRMGEHGFRILEERPGEEVVIGLEGRFWTPSGELATPGAEQFRSAPPAPGSARAAWNFHMERLPNGASSLRTETRVLCADQRARRRLLPYWYLIRPWSGMIREAMLREVRRVAEAGAGTGVRPTR
jgi:hypothetical protein